MDSNQIIEEFIDLIEGYVLEYDIDSLVCQGIDRVKLRKLIYLMLTSLACEGIEYPKGKDT